MKKTLCLILTLALMAATVAFAVTATAAEEVLTVHTARDGSVQLEIGQEVEYITYLYSGEVSIRDGQGYIDYDVDYLEPVPTKAIGASGKSSYVAYSMPLITEGSKMINEKTTPGRLHFNFSNSEGFVNFTIDQPFFVYRFRALKAGETTLTTTIYHMNNDVPVHVFFKGVPDATIQPYFTTSVSVVQEETAALSTDPSTSEPETQPTTSAPETQPTTSEPETQPTTSEPDTQPTTSAPDTQPTTSAPDTQPTTSEPNTQPTTSEPETQPTTSVPETQPSTAQITYEIGDVNLDGHVDIIDVTFIQRHLAKLITMTEQQQKLGDVDRNNIFEILDATRIQQYLAKLIETL